MDTKLLLEQDISEASDILKRGGLVAIPTETVYGLAANALDSEAVSKIFVAKGRPMDNPLIVHISKISDIEKLVSCVPIKAKKLMECFWPGPLTIILPKSYRIPLEVSAGLDTVAIRMPNHKLALKLINKAGIPLAAPSANLSGSPSPTEASHVMKDLGGRINAVLDGGKCEVGLESTVISLAGETPKLFRPGGITLEQLEDVLKEKVCVDPAVLNQIANGQRVESPGMKYKHYAPNARITIINGKREKYINYVNNNSSPGVVALCYDGDVEDLNVKCITYGCEEDFSSQAHILFYALREIDELDGVERVYARCPKPEGVGMAVYNRLIRAAGFEVLDLE